MTNDLRFKLAFDGAPEVVQQLERVSQGVGKSTSQWEQNMRGVAAAMRATGETSVELSAQTQKLLDRYDPLGTKLRALQSDFALLRREMGDNAAPAVAKAFQGLEEDIAKTSRLMATAGVEGFESVAKAADKGALATVGAKRELMVLAHEAMTGNFSRMPGSFMVLAERMSMTEALMSPMTLGLVGVGIAAVGVGVAMVQGAHEQKAMDNALIMTGNYAGLTSDSLNALAHSAAASGGSIGEAKKAATELAAGGKYTGEQIGVITSAAVAMEHATGQSIEKTIKQFETLAAQSTGHSDHMSTAISQAARKLDDEYHFLTLAVYDQIRALEKEGDMKGASALATNEFAKVTKDRAGEVVANVGNIGQAWNSVKESIGGAIDRMNDWGKSATAASEVARLSGLVAALQPGNYGGVAGVYNEESRAAALKIVTEQLMVAKKELFRVNERAADQQALTMTNQREVNAAAAIDLMMKAAQAHGQNALTTALKKYHAELAALPPSDPRNDPVAVAAAEAALTKQYGEKAKAIKHMADAWQSDSVRLYASTLDSLAKAQETAQAKAEGLSKAQEVLRTIEASPHWAQFSRQQQEQIIYAASLAQASEDEVKAKADAKAALESYTKQINDLGKARDSELAKLDTEIAKQKEHNATVGMSKSQVDAYKQAQEDQGTVELQVQAQAIDLLLTKGQIMAENGLIEATVNDKARAIYEVELDRLNRVIAKRKELSAAYRAGVVADGGVEAAKLSTHEWKRGWEETDRTARQAFDAWGEKGQSVADVTGKALRKSLMSAIYDATMKPIAFSIYSSIAGAPGGAGVLGSAGSAASLYSVGAGSAGSLLASRSMGALDIGGFSMAGVEAAFAAIPVWGWAALGAAAILGSANHGTPTQNTGNASATFDASGGRTGYSTAFGGSSAGTDAMLATLQANYMAGARALGLGTVATSFHYGSNTGKDNQNPQFALGGGAGGRSFYQGETGLTDAAVSLAASRAVFAALQGSELPGYLAKVFDGLSAGAMTQQDISNTLAFATSLKDVRYSMLSADQQLQILQTNVASGFASLGTSSATFRSDFVAAIDAGISPDRLAAWQALGADMQNLASAAGSADVTVAAVSRSLADIANERTRLSDQLDALTMSSAELLAKQRNAVDASNQALFDQVQAALQAKDATAALAQTQQDAAAATAQLAATNRTWQDQLDVLTGAATERSIALRDATSDSTRALMQQVWAQQDIKTTADEAAAAISRQADQAAQLAQQARAAAEALRATNRNWQNQLDILTGAQTERSIALRDATDDTTRALMRQVYEQQDLKSAATTAADALAAVTINARALRDTAMSATNDALAGLERAIAAQRKLADAAVSAAQKHLDGVAGVFDLLQAQIKELAPMSAAAGNRWLDAALASGGTSDRQGLSDAIAAARGGLTNTNFASAADAARAGALLANKLSALAGMTGTELSAAQEQLKVATDSVATLDALLQTNREQVAGVREGTLTVVDAIAKLQTALVDELQALQKSFGNSLVTGFATIDTSLNGQVSLEEFKKQFGSLASNETLGKVFDALDTDGSGLLSRLEAIKGSSFSSAQALQAMKLNGLGGTLAPAQSYTLAEVTNAISAALATGASAAQVVNAASTNYGVGPADVLSAAQVTGQTDIAAAASAALATVTGTGGLIRAADSYTFGQLQSILVSQSALGYTAAQLIGAAQANYGISESDVRAAGRSMSLPGFDVGTNYVPRDMVAQIHQGEAIIPAAFNPERYAKASGNDALVAEIKILRKELTDALAKLDASTQRGNEHAKSAADTLSGRQSVPLVVQFAPGSVVKVAP